jgi:carbonic anhydrase
MQVLRTVEGLHDGYRRFRDGRYAEAQERYRQLAEFGQDPQIMLIACCDSRADPAMIFDAGPGGAKGGGQTGQYIDRWASLLAPAFETLPEGLLAEEAAARLERAAIRYSLIQLRSFPFVAEREAQGELSTHGAFFGIAAGVLEWLDGDKDSFRPIV